MFEQILQRMQKKIRQQQYVLTHVLTLHAEEEMEDDNLSIVDVEQGILTGIICERQSDRNTNECKYRIRGFTLDHAEIEVIAKLGLTEKVVIITVYLL